MKQIVKNGVKKTKMIEVEKPVINAENEVLIRVTYCGVCMSEHFNWLSDTEGGSIGHEPVGIVEAVGGSVTRVKVGDKVSGHFNGSAEYAVIPEIAVHKVPDNISDYDAVAEPLACLVSAVSKVKIPAVGDKIAVVGCGYMGCGAISLLKLRGAYVVAVDIRPESLEDAKRYGADEVYTPDQLPEHYTTKNSALAGFPLVMEWGETEESLDLAINMTRQLGQLAIGAYHTGGKRLVNVQLLNARAIDCLSTHPRDGVYNYHCAANAFKMLESGTWDFKNVPTKVYPVSRIDQAHAELETKYGKYMKAILKYTDEDFEPFIVK